METKEVKIVPPKGYEIDKQNSTFERVVFKKIDDKPRSWEEFCANVPFSGDEYYISDTGESKSSISEGVGRCIRHKCYTDSKEEAQAFVALMQLRRLRKAWVGDWEPDWDNDDIKYTIQVSFDNIRIEQYCAISRCLSFPSNEMANEFLKCFKDLLEQAKMLL